jgi:hypothetical protein
MQPNQSLEISLEDSPGISLPLANVIIQVHLFTKGNYRYSLHAGRTDNNGQLNLSYADIEQWRDSNAKHFLMDYNTPLEECDPTVEIFVPTENSLRQAVENVKEGYGKMPAWAADWPSNNQIESGPQKFELKDGTNRIAIPCKLIR